LENWCPGFGVVPCGPAPGALWREWVGFGWVREGRNQRWPELTARPVALRHAASANPSRGDSRRIETGHRDKGLRVDIHDIGNHVIKSG